MKRIGLTMRVVTAEGYTEERDALAWDWHRFLASAFPDACWLSIPNLGNRVDDYIREWRIDGLILTGGNDLGSAPLRDMTERALLGYALENSIPTFGVCRGLQVIQHHFGGAIRPCPGEAHVSTRHSVRFLQSGSGPTERVVNSFHAHGVRADEVADSLQALAVSEDGWVECVAHRARPIVGVQWHPERNAVPDQDDVLLMRRTLGFPDPTPVTVAGPSDRFEYLTPFSFPPCVH
jgi:gamma-glutamyl-gamma-aminobutyrate hydrolase PuuD